MEERRTSNEEGDNRETEVREHERKTGRKGDRQNESPIRRKGLF